MQCCECCCQKDAEIKETKIGYLPANVLDGSISLEADDGNNNDVKILSVTKAKPDNKYSTLIKPTDKFSIKSLITANLGIVALDTTLHVLFLFIFTIQVDRSKLNVDLTTHLLEELNL